MYITFTLFFEVKSLRMVSAKPQSESETAHLIQAANGTKVKVTKFSTDICVF